MELPSFFEKLHELFAKNGFEIYLVGGTSRDILLDIPLRDFDLVTDATPEQMNGFLDNADFTFARFGSVKLVFEGYKMDITTFRKEDSYGDFRHPSKIVFIKDMEMDSSRRDFTINAIYIDHNGKTYDFHNGLDDLKNGIIRFIGDPRMRISEDPLRILRAERFAKRLGFSIDKESQEAIDEMRGLLEKLNPEKIKMESKKG